jgi:hypothetical protein
MDILVNLCVLILLVEAITYMIMKAEPLQPLVNGIKELHPYLEDLLSCGYCLSFWVTLIVVSLFQGTAVQPLELFEFTKFSALFNFLIVLPIVHRLSSVLHGGIDKHFDRHLDKRYRGVFDEFE